MKNHYPQHYGRCGKSLSAASRTVRLGYIHLKAEQNELALILTIERLSYTKGIRPLPHPGKCIVYYLCAIPLKSVSGLEAP
ncbi:MAG: hypothetical protein PUB42_04855 [Firmicutes bacterium]|nr:hypothetical protein [Bacillota bacterium]